MGQGILSHFVLEWSIMKNWPAILWAVFAALVVLIIAIFTVMFIHYKSAQQLMHYEIWVVALPSWFYYMSRDCVKVHVHHYTLMMSRPRRVH